MTTYYHQNSEIHGPDGMQTLVLMNPSHVQYTAESPLPGSSNLVLLNPASATAPTRIAHAQPPQQTQQFLGIPVSTLMALQDQQNAVHATHGGQGISPLHGLIPRMQNNLWNSVEPSSAAPETPASSRSQQGALSLSLFSQRQQPSFRSLDSEREPPQPAASSRGGGGASGGSQSLATVVTSIGIGGVLGIQGLLLSSKYLKAAQELLDEVVNSGSGIKKDDTPNKATCSRQSNAEGKSTPSVTAAGQKEDASRKGEAAQPSMAERQEIQMKKSKLIAMLDETEQRYRHYHQQMRIVISSFEKAAGVGSAGAYTALALRTISRQFRCLKDSIAGQINAANKSMGEKDGPQGKAEGSRLKFVDHQIRQQHALQQLGMIQQNPWRPQRGLPEHSVSILRSWLFEHFLHPYPKDLDKQMLAKQTGLTRSQVSNWFINARVRLWKPMVEDMYSEEMKEHEQSGMDEKTGSDSIDPNEDSTSKPSSLQDKGPSSENDILGKCFNSRETNSTPHDAPATLLNSAASIKGNLRSPPGSGLIGSSELEGITQVRTKKPRSTEGLHSSDSVPFLEDQLTVKYGDARREGRDGPSIMSQPVDFIREIGQCPIREMGRFGAEQFVPGPAAFTSSNAVSLTLGLRQTENLSPLTDHHHQPFLPSKNVHLETRVKPGERNEFGVIDNSATSYETIGIQNHKGNFCPTSLPYLSNF